MNNKPKTIKDSAFYAANGRKGGNATKQRHGSEHYSRIGTKGAQALARKYGENLRDYYSKIGSGQWHKEAHE